MPRFKVYAERTESYCAIIEAVTEEDYLVLKKYI